jgi:hypothetical protein
MLDLLFFSGQVMSVAALACGCYLTLSHGREGSLKKGVTAVRFAEFDHHKQVPAVAGRQA